MMHNDTNNIFMLLFNIVTLNTNAYVTFIKKLFYCWWSKEQTVYNICVEKKRKRTRKRRRRSRRRRRRHRRTSKAIIFRAKAKFFGQKPAAKMNKIYTFVFSRRKTEFIPFSEIKCPKSGIFADNHWVGWVGQSIAVFRALSKKISGKDGPAPLEKIGPYAYHGHPVNVQTFNL